MTDDTQLFFWLGCPVCSCAVFARDVDLFINGERGYCADCGSGLSVAVNESESVMDALAVVNESAGDVVARLRAKVEQLQELNRPQLQRRLRELTEEKEGS